MAGELWDLSSVVERMAVAMWSHDAWRCERYTTAKNRTLEAFRDQSPEMQNEWIGLASAALEAMMQPKEPT